MSEISLILLVSENAANVQDIRAALASGEEQLTLQHIERPRTAAARIAGGGVAVVLLDISSVSPESDNSDLKKRDAFVALRAAAPEIPLVILCEAGDEASAKQMIKEGAVTYLLRPSWQEDLKRRVLADTKRQQVTSVRPDTGNGRKGTVITVAGAKGGVGATTVAVNVAAVLASTSKVILAELRPPFGTLCHFFRPHRATRSLQNLLAMSRDEMEVADVESCLWPNRNIPGLSVLFAPEKAATLPEMASGQAREILRRLTELSEVVVVDLAPSLSETDQAILRGSDTLALVVERDALSVDAAKAKLSALEGFGIAPREAGLVIVNRVPLAAPMALADIESQLGLPTFAVIPPAADLCVSGYRVHIPVVKLDAQSSMATSLVNLAKKLSGPAWDLRGRADGLGVEHR